MDMGEFRPAFPLLRVQVSTRRYQYARGPQTNERTFGYPDDQRYPLLLTETSILSEPMPFVRCDKIERHYARFGVLPGWAEKYFEPGIRGLNFDDHVNETAAIYS